MRLIVSIIFCITCFSSFCQTCLIAVKTDTAVYLAADSRTVTTQENSLTGKRLQLLGTICKIKQYGKWTISFQGHFLSDAQKVAESLKSATSLEEAVKLYGNNFKTLLNTKIMDMKTMYPITYNSLLKDGNIAQAFIAGTNNKSAVFAHIVFTIKKNTMPDSLTRTAAVGYYTYNSNPDAAGHIGEIMDTLRTKNVFAKGIIKTMNYLIDLESKRHPMEVGGGTGIIEISPRGTKWIQKKQPCE